jgi:hypothetical protein
VGALAIGARIAMAMAIVIGTFNRKDVGTSTSCVHNLNTEPKNNPFQSKQLNTFTKETQFT